MDEIKLSDDIIEQIKDFGWYWNLTEEQKSLIDKLITDKELKKRYENYDLCEECKQPNTGYSYCRPCKSQYFKQNFKNWTSGNHDVNEFIQKAQLKAEEFKCILEWIEYDKFEDVEYLAKGGFGTTFKAVWKDGFIDGWDNDNNQWQRNGETKVALKCLHNSQDVTADFLKEVESNIIISSSHVVRCFGITKDSKTNNFIMVMELIDCSLRQHLNDNFISLSWKKKLGYLVSIAYGLSNIHNKGLIHHDFHLLPYVAPEVLRGKEYTQASDIYGYGIIAHEICTGFPPYYDIAHDEILAMKICKGLRPKSNYKIPQLIFDLINQCWDADPLKRPKADELRELIEDLYLAADGDSVINKQINEADEINKKLSFSTVQSPLSSTNTLLYMTHPQAVYASKLLDFKNLPEPKNADNDDLEYSDSLRMDFTKLDINSKGNYFYM
ncbi:kinase-like domain-containing protein, partial [Rhizophagus diaphanus]